jgi:probable phosphoglycerate mutase
MTENIPLLWVVRHGQTILNAEGKFRGNRDVPLDEVGRKDAKRLVKFFEDKDFGLVVCSNRKRAVQTAEPLARSHGTVAHPTEALHALDVGEFSGKPKSKENVAKLEMYISNPDMDIPGGESLNHFRARVQPLFRDGIAEAIKIGKPLVFVIHSSGIHEISNLVYHDHKKILVDPGGVVEVYAQNGKLGARALLRPTTGKTDVIT